MKSKNNKLILFKVLLISALVVLLFSGCSGYVNADRVESAKKMCENNGGLEKITFLVGQTLAGQATKNVTAHCKDGMSNYIPVNDK